MICFSRNSGPAQVQQGEEEEEEGVKWSPRTGTEEGTRQKLILVCLYSNFLDFMHQKLDWGHWFKHLIPPSVYHLQFKTPLRTPPVQYLRHTDQSITMFTIQTWNRILHSENHSLLIKSNGCVCLQFTNYRVFNLENLRSSHHASVVRECSCIHYST